MTAHLPAPCLRRELPGWHGMAWLGLWLGFLAGFSKLGLISAWFLEFGFWLSFTMILIGSGLIRLDFVWI